MSSRPRLATLLALAMLAACNRADAPGPPAKTGSSTPQSTAIQSGDPIAGARPGIITPSPTVRSELLLPTGESVIDLVAAPTRAQTALLLRGADGRARVALWTAGATATTSVAELPAGFQPRAIAMHPVAQTVFVVGASGGMWRILALGADGASRTLLETPREITTLLVAPRPFGTAGGPAYRLFFAVNLPDGTLSLRTITERGTIEYQVAGPASAKVVLPGEDQPTSIDVTAGGTPMSVHPRGEPLLWRDSRGCAHAFSYARVWSEDAVVREIPCEGWTTIAPNGSAYLHWVDGRAGVAVIGVAGAASAPSVQAMGETFIRPPVVVPDGRGMLGVVARSGGRHAVVFAPIALALGDVANAWQLPPSACEASLYAREGGLFMSNAADSVELWSVYDRYGYSEDTPGVPFLATTDLFWESFGAAYNGVFILTERRRAMPAFWAFVDSARTALAATAPASTWGRAFAAIAESRRPNPTGEASLIASGKGVQRSAVLDSTFDFDELTPRGHYSGTAEMRAYFRAMHYLTQVAALRDPAPLAALPASVQRSAAGWIEGYLPFIAAPHGRLVWSGVHTSPVAPYARHPHEPSSVFPLSWGLDNEVLEATVFRRLWPVEQQVGTMDMPRTQPSGLDVASVYGNALARSLLADTIARYPRLGPVLDELRARRPRIGEASNVYDRWLDALGMEWADSTRFPGAPASSRLWETKRLQTALASWATLREATILVNERASAAEAGEGGFEDLLVEQPRGYVEPAPRTFDAIAELYESLARAVGTSAAFDSTLRQGVLAHLHTSAAEARRFGAMARTELRGETLADSDYAEIQQIGGSAEHAFLIYKSIADTSEGLRTPERMAKVADVAGAGATGLLEVAVGNPLEWRQIVPYFGRRQIVVGAVYSYHELISRKPLTNELWRKQVATAPRPGWVQPMVTGAGRGCGGAPAR